VRTDKTLHKSHQKIQYYFQFSIFNIQCGVVSVWRGTKRSDELEKERTPTPQNQHQRKLLLLLTRYFFPKECSKTTTHEQNNRLEFKFLNFFGRILRSVLLHSSTMLHHVFYFLGKIWCSIILQIGLKIISVLLYYTVVLYYILVFKSKGWDLAHRGSC